MLFIKQLKRLFGDSRGPLTLLLSKHHAILEYLPGGAAELCSPESKSRGLIPYQGAKVPPAAIKNKTATWKLHILSTGDVPADQAAG